MLALNECKFMTVRQQKVLLLMFNNDDSITFFDQSLYSNNRSFKKSMRELDRAGVVKKSIQSKKCNDGFMRMCNCYKLTMRGEVFIQTVVKEFDRCNR